MRRDNLAQSEPMTSGQRPIFHGSHKPKPVGLNIGLGVSSDAAVMRAPILLLALVAFPALAQIYSWEDKEGVHYTDDPSTVPKGVKANRQERQLSRPAVEAVAASPKLGPLNTELPVREREWRDRFIEATRRIQTRKQELGALEASLPAKETCSQVRQVVTPTVQGQVAGDAKGQLVTQCVPNPMYDRIRLQMEQKQVEIREAELDLEQLDRRASMESVPREWRRGW